MAPTYAPLMGYWKNQQIQLHDLGYADIGSKFACDDCVEDSDLKAFVADHAAENGCSYCDRTAAEPIAIPVDDLLAEFASAVAQAYRRVGAEDHFEGEYMVHGEPIGNLLEHSIGSPFSNPQLEADIVGAFASDEQWCEANPYNAESPGTSSSKKIIQRTRYLPRTSLSTSIGSSMSTVFLRRSIATKSCTALGILGIWPGNSSTFRV